MNHSNLVNTVLIEANKINGVRLWSNPTGLGYTGTIVSRKRDGGNTYITIKNPRIVKYGLCPGGCDTIGFCEVDGKPVFTGIEIKTGKDIVRPKQKKFIDMLKNNGAIAGIVKSIDDLYKLII
jgi:hypothetical protein